LPQNRESAVHGFGHRSSAGAGSARSPCHLRCSLRRTERRPDARPGHVLRVGETAALRSGTLSLLLPQRLLGARAILPLPAGERLRFRGRALRTTPEVRGTVGPQSPRPAFSRSVHGQVDSLLVRSAERTVSHVSPAPCAFTHSPLERSRFTWKPLSSMPPNTATFRCRS